MPRLLSFFCLENALECKILKLQAAQCICSFIYVTKIVLGVKNVQLEQKNTLKPLQFENKLVSLQRALLVLTRLQESIRFSVAKAIPR